MTLPVIKLDRGLHVMHLFYRVDRVRWSQLPAGESERTRARLEGLCEANSAASHPRLLTYANVGGKADLGFFLLAAELAGLAQMHRNLESAFAPGTLTPVFSYLSVTELTEYMPTDEDNKKILEQEKLEPGSEVFEKRRAELSERMKNYEYYRLYPELPDWEVMGFYPMSKRRAAADNWSGCLTTRCWMSWPSNAGWRTRWALSGAKRTSPNSARPSATLTRWWAITT